MSALSESLQHVNFLFNQKHSTNFDSFDKKSDDIRRLREMLELEGRSYKGRKSRKKKKR